MKRHLNNLQAAFRQVFTRSSYIALASMLAILAFLLAVWFPNLGLIAEVFSTSNALLAAKLGVALSLLGGIATNFSLFSTGYTIAIAVLFGIAAAHQQEHCRTDRLPACSNQERSTAMNKP